ncbi:MAG: hypothetical protein P4L35_11060, partial [Ignavibacteriaceae bacterium]|nr:hypothetical protein [Ignavibacteriaceae bacterium]
EAGKTFSVIVIICLFNPFDKTKKSYRMYTLSKELVNFQTTEIYKIRLLFDADAQQEISLYQNSTIHNCVLFAQLKGSPNKWIMTNPVELDLNLEEGEERQNQ